MKDLSEKVLEILVKRILAERKLHIVTAALTQIRTEEGKVCDNFELCNHRACRSSYSSWYIADEALKKISED